MKLIGLGNKIVGWIEAYLTERISRASAGEKVSGIIPMSSAVSHESVIGQLLFFLFVEDLPHALEALTLLIADAVKMLTCQAQNMRLHRSLITALD